MWAPSAERGLGDLRLRRVHRHRARGIVEQALQHRQQARPLLGGGYSRRTGPGGLRPHVEQIGALGGERPRLVDGRGRVEVPATVGKRIGRHVHDPHDQRPGPLRVPREIDPTHAEPHGRSLSGVRSAGSRPGGGHGPSRTLRRDAFERAVRLDGEDTRDLLGVERLVLQERLGQAVEPC